MVDTNIFALPSEILKDPGAIFFGQLITFLTMIIGLLYQWRVAARNRRWDIEDRRILMGKIEENTKLSKTAAVESISTNDTIAQIGKRFDEVHTVQVRKLETIEHKLNGGKGKD